MKEYHDLGYKLGLRGGGLGEIQLDLEWRDITAPSEDGITWRLREKAGGVGRPYSFRVQATGRTLAEVGLDQHQPPLEVLKTAMLVAIKDTFARSAKIEPDHSVTVSAENLREGLRMASAT